MSLAMKTAMVTPSSNASATNLVALLEARGWQFNDALSPATSPVWDFAPSMPGGSLLGREGHPTGIFIYGPEELGFCDVEPASWSTLLSPYVRRLNDVNDLIALLPQIEHWRAPAALTHACPEELALMRDSGEISTKEMLYSLDHFP